MSNGAGGLVSNGERLIICKSGCHILYDGVWSETSPLFDREYSASSVADEFGNVLVTGGWDSNFVDLQTTEMLKDTGNEPGPDLPSAFHAHCQVLMGTSVYVAGGTGPTHYLSSVFVLESGVWRSLSPMITSRHGHSCIAFEGKMYAIGGRGSLDYLPTVEIYDPISDNWAVGPPLPTSLASAQVINYQDSILLFGGYTGNEFNIQVFTLSGGAWDVLPGVTVHEPGRFIFPAFVINSEVLFCGSVP